MDNPILLLVLFLAIVVMAGYYYLKRAQSRGSGEPRSDDSRDSIG